jgi:hypothetical protein
MAEVRVLLVPSDSHHYRPIVYTMPAAAEAAVKALTVKQDYHGLLNFCGKNCLSKHTIDYWVREW